MKTTPSPHDEKIIELLKRLEALRAEYPPDLLAARRASFVAQIEERKVLGVKREETLSQDRVIELLEGLKPAPEEYPPDMLAARRAAFAAQIEERRARGAKPDENPSQDRIIELLDKAGSVAVDYPPELLASRRAAFRAQIQQRNRLGAREESPAQDRMIDLLGKLPSLDGEYPAELLVARRAAFIAKLRQFNAEDVQPASAAAPDGNVFRLLERLKSIEIEYPFRMWFARRSAFVTQIRDSKTSILEALRSVIQNIFGDDGAWPSASSASFRRLSVIVATLLVAAFLGSLAYGNLQPQTSAFEPAPTEPGASYSSPVVASTSTGEVVQVVCKPGYLPPLCLTRKFDKSQDLTFQGNGSARPAVAKDTLPGYSRIHNPAYVNDGLYGPGASWISNSAYSWLKIDLGEAKTINTVTFGRDRLGQFNDGDPGQFMISVALSDDIYADGNSANDYKEYLPVYDSRVAGFDGFVSGPETVTATFDPVQARYVKITFENAGTAVDEVEVFMIQPLGYASIPTQKPRDTQVPPSFTPIPTKTLVPSKTPTLIPTKTLVPTWTMTLIPTSTPLPTETATPRPTNTEIPTDTPVPPTHTPPPPPTFTAVPPTNTPLPPPTNTPVPPTVTSQAGVIPTETAAVQP